MGSQVRWTLVLRLALLGAAMPWSSLVAAGPTFRPDVIFRGSTLTGWSSRGSAAWRADNGVIIGTPSQAAAR